MEHVILANQFYEIKAQFDQNRIGFLQNELEVCFTLVKVVETERKMGDFEHAKRALANAEEGHTTLRRFLCDPKHAKHIREEERRELTGLMEQLRSTLDSLER